MSFPYLLLFSQLTFQEWTKLRYSIMLDVRVNGGPPGPRKMKEE